MNELMAVLGLRMEQEPKGYPKLAGRGAECFWARVITSYASIIKLVSSKENFEKRVMAVLSSVTPKRSRAYLRKPSDYKRAFRMLCDGSGIEGVGQYAGIEQMRALVKTHRFTFDQGDILSR
jgi:hypothetical protein